MILSFRTLRQARPPTASHYVFTHCVRGHARPLYNAYTIKNNYALLSTSAHRRTAARAVLVSENHAQTVSDPILGLCSQELTVQDLVEFMNRYTQGSQGDSEGASLDYRKKGFDQLNRALWKKRRGVASATDQMRDVIDVYLELKRRGDQYLRGLDPLIFVHVAWRARQENLKTVIHSVVTDVLFLHESASLLRAGQDIERHTCSWDYLPAIAHLLDLVSDFGAHRIEQCLSLTKAFLLDNKDDPSTLPNLSSHALIGISRIIVVQLPEWTIENKPLLEAFAGYLEHAALPSVAEARSSKVQESGGEKREENNLIWALFRLVADLARRGCDEIAYSLFSSLISNEYIHPAAIQESDQAVDDFQIMALSALVRSCVEYGWFDGSYRLLLTADIPNPKTKDQLSRLLYRVVYEAVQTRKRKNIELSSKLIVALFSQNSSLRLSDGLLVYFYTAAMSVDAGEAALKVYAILRSAPVRERHVFPPPSGPALAWFFKYVHRTANTEVARLLAKHLVDTPDSLSIYLRGPVIAQCAAMGFTGPTRKLWERYAQGPDKNMVAGHARTMINVVSLFSKYSNFAKDQEASPLASGLDRLARATTDEITKSLETANLPSGQNDLANEDIDLSQKDPSGDPVSFLQAINEPGPSRQEHMMSLPSDSSMDGAGASITSRELEAQATEAQKLPHGDSISCLISSRSDALDMSSNINSNSAEDTCKPSADLLSQSAPVAAGVDSPTADGSSSAVGEDTHLAFAHHVLDSFRAAKEPLKYASHYDLTSLARGAAILGDIEMSTNTLQLIIGRREVPDLFDLNVIVTSTARWNPYEAGLMVRRMIKSGIKPNGFTFAAVLHAALVNNNPKLAARLFDQARSVGHTQLMPEMCIALLHASLNAAVPGAPDKVGKFHRQPLTTEERESKIEYLRQAYDLLTSDACPPHVRTNQLGRRCIGAAMRLDDPTLAFEFWTLLLNGKTDGFSERQVDQDKVLRQRIADKIRKHCQRGRLEKERGRRMVAELGVRW